MRRLLSLVACSLILMISVSSCAGSSEAKNSLSQASVPEPIEYPEPIEEPIEYPEGVLAEVEAPLHVKQGEKFEIFVTIKNNTSKPQKLLHIRISKKYFNAVAIYKIVPNYIVLRERFLRSKKVYYFDFPIDVDEEIKLVFYGEAIKQGDYDVKFDINTTYEFRSLDKRIRTIID